MPSSTAGSRSRSDSGSDSDSREKAYSDDYQSDERYSDDGKDSASSSGSSGSSSRSSSSRRSSGRSRSRGRSRSSSVSERSGSSARSGGSRRPRSRSRSRSGSPSDGREALEAPAAGQPRSAEAAGALETTSEIPGSGAPAQRAAARAFLQSVTAAALDRVLVAEAAAATIIDSVAEPAARAAVDEDDAPPPEAVDSDGQEAAPAPGPPEADHWAEVTRLASARAFLQTVFFAARSRVTASQAARRAEPTAPSPSPESPAASTVAQTTVAPPTEDATRSASPASPSGASSPDGQTTAAPPTEAGRSASPASSPRSGASSPDGRTTMAPETTCNGSASPRGSISSEEVAASVPDAGNGDGLSDVAAGIVAAAQGANEGEFASFFGDDDVATVAFDDRRSSATPPSVADLVAAGCAGDFDAEDTPSVPHDMFAFDGARPHGLAAAPAFVDEEAPAQADGGDAAADELNSRFPGFGCSGEDDPLNGMSLPTDAFELGHFSGGLWGSGPSDRPRTRRPHCTELWEASPAVSGRLVADSGPFSFVGLEEAPLPRSAAAHRRRRSGPLSQQRLGSSGGALEERNTPILQQDMTSDSPLVRDAVVQCSDDDPIADCFLGRAFAARQCVADGPCVRYVHHQGTQTDAAGAPAAAPAPGPWAWSAAFPEPAAADAVFDGSSPGLRAPPRPPGAPTSKRGRRPVPQSVANAAGVYRMADCGMKKPPPGSAPAGGARRQPPPMLAMICKLAGGGSTDDEVAAAAADLDLAPPFSHREVSALLKARSDAAHPAPVAAPPLTARKIRQMPLAPVRSGRPAPAGGHAPSVSIIEPGADPQTEGEEASEGERRASDRAVPATEQDVAPRGRRPPGGAEDLAKGSHVLLYGPMAPWLSKGGRGAPRGPGGKEALSKLPRIGGAQRDGGGGGGSMSARGAGVGHYEYAYALPPSAKPAMPTWAAW